MVPGRSPPRTPQATWAQKEEACGACGLLLRLGTLSPAVLAPQARVGSLYPMLGECLAKTSTEEEALTIRVSDAWMGSEWFSDFRCVLAK